MPKNIKIKYVWYDIINDDKWDSLNKRFGKMRGVRSQKVLSDLQHQATEGLVQYWAI